MKRKVITLKRGINYPTFISKARKIQTCLSSGMFNTVTPTPAEVSPLLDQLEVFQAQVDAHNTANIGQRDELRLTIHGMISAQCASVNGLANGNMALLEASGFELNKVREPRPMPTKGSTPTFTNLGDGTVIISAAGIRYHDFIEMEIDGPQGLCNHYSSLYTKLKVADLPVGVVLKARMRGINSSGNGQWTDSLSFRVYDSAQHDSGN